MGIDEIDIGSKIKNLRLSRKLTLQALADNLSELYPEGLNFNKGKLSKWENNREEPKLSSVKLLADYFNVTIDDIYRGETNTNLNVVYNKLNEVRKHKVVDFAEAQLKEQNQVQLLGGVAANPQAMEYGDENYDEYVTKDVPKNAEGALVVHGDSMEPEFADGSIVFYKQQQNVENGQLAVVEIDGHTVTFKKVYFNYDDNVVILKSLNEKYEDRELEPHRVRILGLVVR